MNKDEDLFDAYETVLGDSMWATHDQLKAAFRAMTDYQAALLGAYEGLLDAKAIIDRGFALSDDKEVIDSAIETAKQYLDELNIEDGWERKVLDE